MGGVQGSNTFWVMWIGPRQWEGLAGEFNVGQPGWVCTTGRLAEVFILYPASGSESAWLYGVSCTARDFLRFGTPEHV